MIKENGFTFKKRQEAEISRRNADYAYDLTLHANTPAKAKASLYNPKQTTWGIGLYVNTNKSSYFIFLSFLKKPSPL